MSIKSSKFPDNWQDSLAQNGHFKGQLVLDDTINEAILYSRWEEVDKEFLQMTCQNGDLFKFLNHFCAFKEIEFIISIRDAQNEWEEDGIWHDDGSRKMAFSLSITHKHIQKDIQGGVLELRKKGEGGKTSFKIPPFALGEIVVFATGQDHYEHKINQVTQGKRGIIAGWCR